MSPFTCDFDQVFPTVAVSSICSLGVRGMSWWIKGHDEDAEVVEIVCEFRRGRGLGGEGAAAASTIDG